MYSLGFNWSPPCFPIFGDNTENIDLDFDCFEWRCDMVLDALDK